VLTSDTAIAHLAGALGVPVWVALSFVPDWRWQLERSDSPWYPSMRLFRQNKSGDWAGVFARMTDELGRPGLPPSSFLVALDHLAGVNKCRAKSGIARKRASEDAAAARNRSDAGTVSQACGERVAR
jgi:hypothetical protein